MTAVLFEYFIAEAVNGANPTADRLMRGACMACKPAVHFLGCLCRECDGKQTRRLNAGLRRHIGSAGTPAPGSCPCRRPQQQAAGHRQSAPLFAALH